MALSHLQRMIFSLMVALLTRQEGMFCWLLPTQMTNLCSFLQHLATSLPEGDADGKGNIRKYELYLACAILKVPGQQVRCLDHAELQDGFGKVWSHDLLATIIEEEVAKHGIDLIITFDDYGVSGHCNHRDVHHGVRKLLHDTSQQDIEAWELVSTNLLRKYSGPVDIWLSYLCALRCSSGVTHCFINEHPRKSFLAMAQHSSQWVWFRKLFVALSSYTYVNTLRRID
ncbi:probable N-acetylglucosaminyl-phosphatidylinositol de-N-acetylase isoform X2 [Morus notabilis]|uniref:probable N-acetylglucosaminyl-phosphatidylinositol de-N-acetylase isoform X2 n=1 Tax=Morus notabilis TaxID=981085 RepID=UPI000CED53BA|nr:probable N-acetylglucosaminyl-phosphatidylinositol de-N-acetylase isoform X2 [Morus notabilis]